MPDRAPSTMAVPVIPIGYTVELRTRADDKRFTLTGEGAVPQEVPAAKLEASFDGEVLELALTATEELIVEVCRAVLRHAYTSDEEVLLNGYQSWTDTEERPAWSRMQGLHGIPKKLVEDYALDGGGDYRFTFYPNRRGMMHGYTYATFRRGENLALVASLDESHGFTLIRTDAAKGTVTLETEAPKRYLDAGERFVLCRYAIVGGDIETVYDRWFELSGIKARAVDPVIGYTSWYRHYGDISYEKLADDLEGCAQQLAEIEAPGLLKLFQIDDGYCKVGDWFDVDEEKFPNGMRPLVDRARELGLLPGLWVAPFVCEQDSRLAYEHEDWLMRDEKGLPVRTGCQWSGGLALDTRNPEVRSYVLDVMQTVSRDWGFGLLKLDFLFAACMIEHDGMNRGELMLDAIDLLRRGMGEECLMLACGVPLASVFGKADYCRIGCDVGLDWNDKIHYRFLHRERVSTRNSLANSYGRVPLDGRAFGNDPDVFFMRDDVALSQMHRDALMFGNADLGSVMLTSDDMGKWDDRVRARYREALKVFCERHGIAYRS